MWYRINEALKGLRGIILAWLLTALTYAESVYNLTAMLMMKGDPIVAAGGWKYAAFIAVGVTLKNLITDVNKRD
jgi:hypothetical protein